jgi:hypothetical protein
MIVGNAGEAFSIQLINRPSARGLPDRTAATSSGTSPPSTDNALFWETVAPALAPAAVFSNGDHQGITLFAATNTQPPGSPLTITSNM